MGEERKKYMYQYVNGSEVKKAKQSCRRLLEDLCSKLRKKGVHAQVWLLGSGGSNVVTRNGNEPFDLDYNLLIQKMESQYENNPKLLKDTVICEINSLVEDTPFSSGHDRRSVITVNVMCMGKKEYSMDIALVKMDNKGKVYRLIRQKQGACYVWNESRELKGIKKKKKEIQKRKGNESLRVEYLKLKNLYLSRNDETHPSFIIYAEAVNHVYDQLCKKA